jgi:hypothetical protein
VAAKCIPLGGQDAGALLAVVHSCVDVDHVDQRLRRPPLRLPGKGIIQLFVRLSKRWLDGLKSRLHRARQRRAGPLLLEQRLLGLKVVQLSIKPFLGDTPAT